MIAYVTGSGFYDMPGFTEETVKTRFGGATLLRGKNARGAETVLLPRHSKGHARLPHHINHRAHLAALKETGATAVVSLSVCGVLDPGLPLGTPVLAGDVHFPDNRLGDGSACTLFTEPGAIDRGHLLAGSLLHGKLSAAIAAQLAPAWGPIREATYAHVPGPRFNTRVEIRALRSVGADILSQTCGPEAVLANELELPYGLVGFTIDYANGVNEHPTPLEVLKTNLERATSCFRGLVDGMAEPADPWRFENFVYRFPS